MADRAGPADALVAPPPPDGGWRTRLRRWAPPVAGVVVGVVAAAPVAAVPGASAHDINMGWTVVATISDHCFYQRAEIDHPDESNYRHRFYWTVNLRSRNTAGSCGAGSTGYLRRKGQSLVSSDGYAPYSVCASTVGDGLGAAGYYHGTAAQIGGNSNWDNSGACGLGHYKAKTRGAFQNGGWIDGEVVSGSHGFK